MGFRTQEWVEQSNAEMNSVILMKSFFEPEKTWGCGPQESKFYIVEGAGSVRYMKQSYASCYFLETSQIFPTHQTLSYTHATYWPACRFLFAKGTNCWFAHVLLTMEEAFWIIVS